MCHFRGIEVLHGGKYFNEEVPWRNENGNMTSGLHDHPDFIMFCPLQLGIYTRYHKFLPVHGALLGSITDEPFREVLVILVRPANSWLPRF